MSNTEFMVTYTVRAGITGSAVHERSVFVSAEDEHKAEQAAVDWVHDNDIYCDQRVDPIVEIVSCEPTVSF